MSPFSEAAILRWPTQCRTGCPRGCTKLPSLLTELTWHVYPAKAVWCLSRQIPERPGTVPTPQPVSEGHLFPRAMAYVEVRCSTIGKVMWMLVARGVTQEIRLTSCILRWVCRDGFLASDSRRCTKLFCLSAHHRASAVVCRARATQTGCHAGSRL